MSKLLLLHVVTLCFELVLGLAVLLRVVAVYVLLQVSASCTIMYNAPTCIKNHWLVLISASLINNMIGKMWVSTLTTH